MLPIIWIAIALVAAITAITVYEYFRGKRICILGAQGTGKTHLFNFLHTGSIPEEYFQTQEVTKLKGRKIKLNEIEMKIAKGKDVPGAFEVRESIWKKIISESDFVIYLFRLPCLYECNTSFECLIGPIHGQICPGPKVYVERVKSDIKFMEDTHSGKKFICVGTFGDKTNDFIKLRRQNLEGSFIENYFIKHPNYNLFKDRLIVVGSMENLEETEKLTAKILSTIMEGS